MADDLGVQAHGNVVDMEAVAHIDTDQPLDSSVLHEEQDVGEDLLQQALAEAAASNNFDDTVPNLSENDDSAFQSVSHEPEHEVVSSVNNVVAMNDNEGIATQSPSKTQNLGSKNNPIRIVQQGNTYTSMQQLTPSQIQQIAQVLQQQNIGAKSTESPTGSTVVFNPETNTRVVYRVIYPNDLHSKGGQASNGQVGGTSTASSSTQLKGMTAQEYHQMRFGKRRSKKRKISEEDEIWSSGDDGESFDGDSDSDVGDMHSQELTKAEKEELKRQKPITRSGRISKPPSHMVKDYKQIHRVDWYEDFDDSDGGYSDFRASDEESQEYQLQATSGGKLRNWRCESCGKGYIGKLGLARHYRQKTDHGDAEKFLEECEKLEEEERNVKAEEEEKEQAAETGGSGDGAAVNNHSSIEITPHSTEKRGRGRPRKDGSSFKPVTTSESTPVQSTRRPGRPSLQSARRPGRPPKGTGRPPGRPRLSSEERKPPNRPSLNLEEKRPRGRPSLNPVEKRRKRREQLAELVRFLPVEDVLDIVMPALSEANLSLWDLMMNKFGGTEDCRPGYTKMLQMYTALQGEMTESAKTCLRRLEENDVSAEGKETIHIPDECIAISLGLQVGKFEVTDPVVLDEQDYDKEQNFQQQMDVAEQQEGQPEILQDTQQKQQLQDMQDMQRSIQTVSQPEQPNIAVQQPEQAEVVQEVTQSQPRIIMSVTEHGLVPHTSADKPVLQPGASLLIPNDTHQSQENVSEELVTSQLSQLVTQSDSQASTISSHEMTLPPEGQSITASTSTDSVLHYSDDSQNIVIPDGASIVQTDEGFVIYQDAESGIRLSENTIPLETVQALLAMDQSGQYQFASNNSSSS